MFKVGDKVICIDASPHAWAKGESLTAGSEYIVSDAMSGEVRLVTMINFWHGKRFIPASEAANIKAMVTDTPEIDYMGITKAIIGG